MHESLISTSANTSSGFSTLAMHLTLFRTQRVRTKNQIKDMVEISECPPANDAIRSLTQGGIEQNDEGSSDLRRIGQTTTGRREVQIKAAVTLLT